MKKLDFRLFEKLLRERNVEEAKKLVTPENIHDTTNWGGILVYVCCDGPDEPDLLRYFVAMGASLEIENNRKPVTPLGWALRKSNYNQIKELLRLGVPVNSFVDNLNHTPLFVSLYRNDNRITKLLLDAGAKISKLPSNGNEFVTKPILDFIASREATRQACIVVLGMKRCGSRVLQPNGIDVLRVIGRCLWETRGYENI